MPCRTKSGTRKTGSQNAKKPPARKIGKTAASKSVDTKENRYITDFFPTVSRRMLAAKLKIDNENKLIRHCVESCTDPVDNLVITEFENKGKGIVARVPIKKDSFICEYSGDLIKLEDAEKREKEYEMNGEGCYMYYFNWNSVVWCVDATKPTGRLGRLINHSRKAPNCKTKVFEHNKIPHLIFIALRDIGADEEVLYDYGERDPNAIRSNPWLTST